MVLSNKCNHGSSPKCEHNKILDFEAIKYILDSVISRL